MTEQERVVFSGTAEMPVLVFVFPFTEQIVIKPWAQNTSIVGALRNKIIFLKYSPYCQDIVKLRCHEELEISSVAVAKSQANQSLLDWNPTKHLGWFHPILCQLSQVVCMVSVLVTHGLYHKQYQQSRALGKDKVKQERKHDNYKNQGSLVCKILQVVFFYFN